MSLRISHTELLLLTKHLAMMTQTGLTLSVSIGILRDQARRNLKKILDRVEKRVSAGAKFSDALAEHPRVFSSLYHSLVAVGEESGTLAENLEQLSLHLEKEHQFRSKVQGAMIYPALVLSATVIIGGFLSIVVLPRVTRVFSLLDVELPLSTRIVLGVSSFLQVSGWWFLPLTLGGFIGLVLLLRQKWMAPIWHPVLLRIPVIGKLSLNSGRAQFCRNLGLLLKSGIPLVSAMDTVSRASQNVVFRNGIDAVKQSVLHGHPLAGALEQHGHIFPKILSQMVHVGEESGTLDQTLAHLTTFYDNQVDVATKNLTTLLEPILLLVIGVGVGFFALSILMPIWSATGAIHR